MHDIQVYAQSARSEIDGNTLRINLDGVDLGNIISEFSAKDVLENLDLSDVAKYVADTLKDREE